MNRIALFFLCSLFSFACFSQNESDEKIKYRKLTYNDFSKFSINDTSAVIIDVFFDKKDNAALGQMSLLPVTSAIAIIPYTRPIGIGLTIIAFPFFLNGSYLLVKYRNKKLYMVLTEYQKTQQLPEWVRKKANKQLEAYEMIKAEY